MGVCLVNAGQKAGVLVLFGGLKWSGLRKEGMGLGVFDGPGSGGFGFV